MFLFLAFALGCLCTTRCQITTLSDLDAEVATIVDNYFDKQSTIPIQTVGSTLSVTVDFDLVSLVNVNDVSRHLTLSGYLTVMWTEERYTTITDNINVGLSASTIWTPPLVVINAASQYMKVGSDDDVVKFNLNSASVEWKPWIYVTVPCDSNQFYPFDEYTCSLKISSFDYEESELRLEPAGTDVCTEDFKESDLWQLKETSTRNLTNDVYSVVEFKVTIQRRSSFTVPVVVISMSLVTFLHLFVSLLPQDSHQCLQFSVISALVVIITIIWITSYIPVITSPVPILVYYILSELFLNFTVTFVVVVSTSGLIGGSFLGEVFSWRTQTRVTSLDNTTQIDRESPTDMPEGPGKTAREDDNHYDNRSHRGTTKSTDADVQKKENKMWRIVALCIFLVLHVCFTLIFFLVTGLL